MKIHGGSKEIVNNQYFINAPEISSIIEKVYTFFGTTDSDDQEHHYQLKGCKNKRISDDVEKLPTVLDYHNTNFEESDCVYNTVNKNILPEKFAKVFLNHEQEGEKRLQEFTNGSFEGSISIWKPLKKTKLPTFNANAKSFKTNIDGKTIRFKEERNLMSRLIVAARSRPEIDIRQVFR